MRYFFIGLFAFCLFAFSVDGRAQTSIAVVDVERVLNEAKAAKALNKKRSDAREAFLSELSKKESALREEGKALFAKRQDLGDEEFAKQQRAYEQKLLDLRKTTQKQKREFEIGSNKALDALKDHLANSVKEIAKEQGYGLVISNRDVIAGENSLDITDQTIKAMNDKKIAINFETK